MSECKDILIVTDVHRHAQRYKYFEDCKQNAKQV